MANPDKVTIRQTDAHGEEGSTAFFLQAAAASTWDTDLAALMGNIAALSEATVEPELTLYGASEALNPGTPYARISDKAVFIFLDSDGREVSMELPVPEATIFEADDETVDPLDSLVNDFVTQMFAFAASKASIALVSFLRGFRKKARRK